MSTTVAEFYHAGREQLDLQVVQGEEYLGRVIPEPALNRPGLALAGFFQYFANKRIQVMGLAELTYLKSLQPEAREERIKQFFQTHIPAVVVTRGRKVPRGVLKCSEEMHVPILKTSQITMNFINAATIILEDLGSPTMRMHGTMVDVMGMGVLIKGDPGLGKSEIGLALVKRGHSLVADDVTVLHRDRWGAIMGSALEVTRYHMEIRGLGLIHVPSLFGISSMRIRMKLDLIVHLKTLDGKTSLDRTGLSPQTVDVMGSRIPEITIPVAPGRDLSLIVEVAALNQKLKIMGHDAAKELDDKLIGMLSKKAGTSA